MASILDKKITATDFAALVGVSQQAISQRVQEGLLVAGRPLREWIAAYTGKLRDEAAGRGGDDQKSLTRARTRDAEASANLKNLQIQEKAGLLVMASEIEPGLVAMVTAARQELLALPDRITNEVRALYGVDIDPALITERIHESLQHLSSRDPDRIRGNVEEGDEELGATAQDDDD